MFSSMCIFVDGTIANYKGFEMRKKEGRGEVGGEGAGGRGRRGREG